MSRLPDLVKTELPPETVQTNNDVNNYKSYVELQKCRTQVSYLDMCNQKSINIVNDHMDASKYQNNYLCVDTPSETVSNRDSGPVVGHMKTGIKDNFDYNPQQSESPYLNASQLFNIQITNWETFDHNNGTIVNLVFIQGVNKENKGRIYTMHSGCHDHRVLFHKCYEPPSGYLQVVKYVVWPLRNCQNAMVFFS